MKRYEEQDRTADTAVEAQLTLYTARGGAREREVTLVTRTRDDDTRMQLIRFLSPADVAGTGFLSIEQLGRDDDNWLYLPALRKTRRIAGSDKTDRFVGTDFTYEDLDREQLAAYAYQRTGEEPVGTVDAWVVEATPTDPRKIEESGYSRRTLWVSKDHHLIVQARFYDKDGAYVKQMEAEDIRQVPGTEKWRPYRLTMEDVRSGSRTVLEIRSYVIDQGVSDDFFTHRYLKRGGG